MARERPSVGNCYYHLCEYHKRNRTKLFRCEYCGEYFCKNHLRSSPPSAPAFSYARKRDAIKMDEWRKPDGHPCPPYLEIWEREQQIRNQDYSNTLDTLLKSSKKEKVTQPYNGNKWQLKPQTDEKESSLAEIPLQAKPPTSEISRAKRYYWSRKRERAKKLVIILIIIGLGLYLLYLGKDFGLIPTYFNNPSNNKPEIDVNELEKEIHNLINIERQKQGLSTLIWDDRLAEIARTHSQDMATQDYFSHDDPSGCDPTCRYNKNNYYCHIDLPDMHYVEGGAENIFQNNLYSTVNYINSVPVSYDWNTQEKIARTTVQGWMNSQGHRENILISYWRKEGIGIAISGDDKVYITENFC